MTYPNRWCPKGLREHLCQQQTYAPDDATRRELQRAINLMNYHRPVGSDGKHNDRHTPTCGCEDKGERKVEVTTDTAKEGQTDV